MRTSADACRVLSLDGEGAKGFYTLGVLKEIEAMVGQPICECFDLIFGTSTGGIIAGLLGYQVRQITAIPEMLTTQGRPCRSGESSATSTPRTGASSAGASASSAAQS